MQRCVVTITNTRCCCDPTHVNDICTTDKRRSAVIYVTSATQWLTGRNTPTTLYVSGTNGINRYHTLHDMRLLCFDANHALFATADVKD